MKVLARNEIQQTPVEAEDESFEDMISGVCFLRQNDFGANQAYCVDVDEMYDDSGKVKNALAKAEKFCNDDNNQDKWEKALDRAYEYSNGVESFDEKKIKTYRGKKYYVTKPSQYGQKSKFDHAYEIQQTFKC